MHNKPGTPKPPIDEATTLRIAADMLDLAMKCAKSFDPILHGEAGTLLTNARYLVRDMIQTIDADEREINERLNSTKPPKKASI